MILELTRHLLDLNLCKIQLLFTPRYFARILAESNMSDIKGGVYVRIIHPEMCVLSLLINMRTCVQRARKTANGMQNDPILHLIVPVLLTYILLIKVALWPSRRPGRLGFAWPAYISIVKNVYISENKQKEQSI